MQQPQDVIQAEDQHRPGRLLWLGLIAVKRTLRELDGPVAELVPKKLVERRGRFRELEFLKGSTDLAHYFVGPPENPAGRQCQRSIDDEALIRPKVAQVDQRKSGGVPQLVCKRPVPADAVERELDV